MRILCAIGLRGGADLVRRALAVVSGSSPELVLVHVIDEGPRHELEHAHGPLHHGPRSHPERWHSVDVAETAAGEEALEEARATADAAGVAVTTQLERGNPEHAIVALAEEREAGLIVIRAREHPELRPPRGPKSVGHTARFVVDHASCDVLLLRTD